MTSKEALDTLVYGLCNRNYTKEDLGITMSRCREIVTKDLEVLEILRRNVFKSDSSISIILDDLRNFEDFNKVKEWIKNDER